MVPMDGNRTHHRGSPIELGLCLHVTADIPVKGYTVTYLSRIFSDYRHAVHGMLVRVVGYDPTASCVRGRHSTRLSYTLSYRSSNEVPESNRL